MLSQVALGKGVINCCCMFHFQCASNAQIRHVQNQCASSGQTVYSHFCAPVETRTLSSLTPSAPLAPRFLGSWADQLSSSRYTESFALARRGSGRNTTRICFFYCLGCVCDHGLMFDVVFFRWRSSTVSTSPVSHVFDRYSALCSYLSGLQKETSDSPAKLKASPAYSSHIRLDARSHVFRTLLAES